MFLSRYTYGPSVLEEYEYYRMYAMPPHHGSHKCACIELARSGSNCKAKEVSLLPQFPLVVSRRYHSVFAVSQFTCTR